MSPRQRLSLVFVAGLALVGALAVVRKADLGSGARGAGRAPEGPRELPASRSLATAEEPMAARDEAIEDPEGLTTAHAFEAAERERLARDRELYQELKNKPERTSLELQMMHNLEETNRYPQTNQRFMARAHDPLTQRGVPESRSKKSEDGTRVLSIWTSANQLDVGASLTVFAELKQNSPAGAKVRTEPGLLKLALVREDLSHVADFSFVNHANAPSTARIDSTKVGGGALPAGFYKLVVTGPDGLRAITAFDVRPAYGRLTGNYRDREQGGALIIEAEVEAFDEGRYLAMATLYTDDDIPIGAAQAAQQLTAGTHWIPLSFSGLLVRDGGRNGPFRLAQILLDKQNMPVSTGVRATPDYRTAPYSLNAFSAEPYNRLEATDEE